MLLLKQGNWFVNICRTIAMALIELIYELIAGLYNLFMYLTEVRLFEGENESIISDIYNRIQVILAVVMVFYVTFEFVKYIVSPDTFSDKEKGGGGLLKRILIVIVLMAFTPTIFGMAYTFQSRVIKSNVIAKVMITNYSSSDVDSDDAGGKFSSSLLKLFYMERTYKYSTGYKAPTCGDDVCECDDDKSFTAKEAIEANLEDLRLNGSIDTGDFCLNDVATDETELPNGKTVKKNKIYLIDLSNWYLAIGVGLFMTWMLVLYCAEAGRVVIQFAFLQIIAPIPIISYIAPGKDGMFNKWLKQCVTTYLDLFIRLFIMYLVLLVTELLFKIGMSGELYPGYEDLPDGIKNWVLIFLIIGLLLFAIKAPKMIKELLPGNGSAAGGDFGLKPNATLTKGVARTAGGALGAAYGGLRKGHGYLAANHARNQKIKDELRKEGKPTDRKSMREARQEAHRKAREARRELNKARREYDKASKARDEEKDLSGLSRQFNAASRNFVAADEARAKSDKMRTRNTALNAFGGLVTGTVSGAVTGLKTTKITELHKTVSNVNKTVEQSITKSQKWADAGVMNVFEQTKTRVLNAIPGLSEPELVKTTLKEMQTEAKEFEKKSTQEMKVKGTMDELTTQLESKVTKSGKTLEMDSKTVTNILDSFDNVETRQQFTNFLEDQTGFDVASGKGIELGSTLVAMDTLTESAKAELNAAAQSGDSERISAANKKHSFSQLIQQQLRKALVDKAAQGVVIGKYDDQNIVGSLANNKENVLASLAENADFGDINTAMAGKLGEGALFDAFTTGNYSDEDTLDTVMKKLSELGGEHSREASARNSFVNQYGSGYAATQIDEWNDLTGSGKK